MRADERTYCSRYKDKNFIFKLAKKFKHDDRDVVCEKCVEMTMATHPIVTNPWLLNPWRPEDLPCALPVAGVGMVISEDMVRAIGKLKSGKAGGPSSIMVDMMK